MSELVGKKFYMNKTAEIVKNEDDEIFVIHETNNKNFKINEITAFLLSKMNQSALNIEQMVTQLNLQYADIGKIESKMVEPIIDNLYRNGILTCDGDENIAINNKKSRAMLRFELNPTWFRGEVKTNPNFLFNGRKKLISFIIFYFIVAISIYFYALASMADSIYHSYERMLLVLPILLIHVLGHEMAHMYVCRKMGGEVNKIGVGLLYYFIPVAFVTYKNTYLISRVSRAKVAIAGPLFDLTMLMFVSFLILTIDSMHPILFSYSIMIFSMQFFNLNILMPSDFYRFLESLSGKYNIRRKSFTYLLSIFRLKKSTEYPKEKRLRTRVFYITYGLLSFLYIAFLLGSMLFAITYIF